MIQLLRPGSARSRPALPTAYRLHSDVYRRLAGRPRHLSAPAIEARTSGSASMTQHENRRPGLEATQCKAHLRFYGRGPGFQTFDAMLSMTLNNWSIHGRSDP
ncbi:hypothetical protein CC1G_14268 [Coprinopsis cinerea okayama7|uniref:Uncharacterized protein n=1 Tax=Coprinopsis cinerea (strain Okayama-7 / 130 / ATCC MYA-4618 / FGSC 9003) TaxID=240176 RepID=D6RLF9_COPC7|nr:hypothetical protein CC1G_14268 [Coprinopsis cinerea okayama7\|eukprot:XP_002911737.1 hypothetical protein CC1G_14268 [Coprinopsis cinerea okayama7\